MRINSTAAKSIFLRAVEEHSPCQWSGFLDEACGADENLKWQVEILLDAHGQAGRFLEEGAIHPGAMMHMAFVGETLSTELGTYRLVHQIGEGGMGLVFVAAQEEPVLREVAVKIIRPGMDTREVTGRFDVERRALALMDHPNIARVFDAGETASGRPYFVMEFVRGVPITEYCSQHDSDLTQRLKLFVLVCNAVQHAHYKGIIHRDIKPSNVLVTLLDDRPVPKVIDFGIAKAISQTSLCNERLTTPAQVLGTPQYMSPEQAGLGGLDTDARTDIYSLGVLLYELLTGVAPFDRHAPVDELRRMIREDEPMRPSSRLGRSKVARPLMTAHGSSESGYDGQHLRVDLDWIVMKAMEKDRSRRYETAEAVAADVNRFLSDERVVARPPSALYRVRKFYGRNTAEVTASVCVGIAFVVAVSFSIEARTHRLRENEARLSARHAELQRQQAEVKAAEAEKARQAAELLAERARFAKQEPEIESLVEQAQRLETGLHPDFPRAVRLLSLAIQQHPAQSELYLYRGSAQCELGRFREAIVDLEKAIELQPRSNPAGHWLAAIAARELGDQETAQYHQDAASCDDEDSPEALVVQALAMPYDERGVDLLSEAITRQPFAPLFHFYRGRIAYNLAIRKGNRGFYRMAINDLERALLGRPGDARIIEMLCRCLVVLDGMAESRQQALSRAKDLLDQWSEEQPNNVARLRLHALWLARGGQTEPALKVARQDAHPEPAEPMFHDSLVCGLISGGSLEHAMKHVSTAIELQRQQTELDTSLIEAALVIRFDAPQRREFPASKFTSAKMLSGSEETGAKLPPDSARTMQLRPTKLGKRE